MMKMTTKTTMNDAVMRCCVVLGILLMGVPSGQGQCFQKASECSSSLSTRLTSMAPLLTSSPPNVTALEEMCRTVKQSLTSCVTEAKAACADQPEILASLDTLLDSLDTYCGPALICQLRATTCQAPMLAVLPTGPPPSDGSDGVSDSMEMLQKVCPVYPGIIECLQDLSATEQCGSEELVQNMTAAIQLAASACSVLTGGGGSSGGGGVCLQSFGCFSSFLSASEDRCAAMGTVVQCLNGLKDTCNLDESKMTFTQLTSLINSLCTEMSEFPAEYQNCSAVEQCVMTDPGLGLATLVAGGDIPDISSISTVLSNLTDPAFLCRYLQVSVNCTLSQSQVCQYSQQYVEAMSQQQKNLQQSCPKTGTSVNDGTSGSGANTGDTSVSDDGSGGERLGGQVTHWILTTVSMLTTALLFAV